MHRYEWYRSCVVDAHDTQKSEGIVTSALFATILQPGGFRPDLLRDARPLQLSVPLVGIVGNFTSPRDTDACSSTHGEESSAGAGTRKWLWVAGGIEIMSFLTMLASLQERKSRRGFGDMDDITFVLSAREPDVLLPLVVRVLEYISDHFGQGRRGTLSIYVFSRPPASSSAFVNTASQSVLAVEATQHAGRLSEDTLRALNIDNVQERQTYMCGPEGFEQVVLRIERNGGGFTKHQAGRFYILTM